MSITREAFDLCTRTVPHTNLFLCDSTRREIVDAVLEAVLGHLIVGRYEILELYRVQEKRCRTVHTNPMHSLTVRVSS